MIISASTIAIAAKPSNLLDQAYIKGNSEEFKWLLYEHFVELYDRLYEKTGKEPQGILRILGSIGR